MTVHFVTTGMSLRTHSRCWKVGGGFEAFDIDGKPNDELSDDESRSLAGLRQVVFDRLDQSNPDSNANDVCRDHFRQETWHQNKGKLLSAELNTLAKMRHADMIQGGDEIHLLRGTSSPVGDRATNHHVSALLLAILRQQSCHGGALQGVNVESSGPYAWDPMNERAFLDGAKSVWAKICNTACKFPVSLVLTGGYKAILIYLAMHVAKSERKTTIHYVYDSDDARLVSIDVEGGEAVRLRTTIF